MADEVMPQQSGTNVAAEPEYSETAENHINRMIMQIRRESHSAELEAHSKQSVEPTEEVDGAFEKLGSENCTTASCNTLQDKPNLWDHLDLDEQYEAMKTPMTKEKVRKGQG